MTLEEHQLALRVQISERGKPKVQKVRKLKPRDDWRDIAVTMRLKKDTYRAISKVVRVKERKLARYLKSDAAEDRTRKISGVTSLAELKGEVKGLAAKALDIIHDVLYSNDPDFKHLRVKLAQDILDRCGIKEAEEHVVTHNVIYDSMTQAIKDTAKEIAEEVKTGHA